ncbi:hypothetical protein BOTBODRAFT_60857 [Botryobasidium botryosum FD-172 SS1]|uniref:Condensation domain-containing protein n=1 Tax=Botryobasidium botryosum (strain FD-172 SS1) TaxID=930990 RepID=A0A067LS49_BOTB1|nr:hypothetical protein BOTBODRAFT_60857 [Botryobasidium botryosum FD-172 SS1]
MSGYTWAPSTSDPKRWSRRMYGTEPFFNAAVSASDIRRAWILTCYNCPSIAVRCQPSADYPEDSLEFAYHVETLSEVGKWANESINRRHDAPAGSDIFATTSDIIDEYNNTDGPYPHEGVSAVRLSWCLLGDGNSIALFFRALHAPVDLRGTFIIMDRMFKNLVSSRPIESLHWGEEVACLPNPVPITAGLWKPSAEPTPEYLEWADATITKLGLTDEPFCFPSRIDESPTPTLIHREIVQMPSSALKKFRDTCVHHDLTVTEAITAILFIAQSTAMERHYKFLDSPLPDTPGTMAFFPVDARRYIQEEHAGNAVTFANIPLDLLLMKKTIEDSGCLDKGRDLMIGKTFWDEFCSKFRKGWRDEAENQDIYAYSHDWMGHVVAGLEGVPDAHETIGPIMSSVGAVNAYIASQYHSDTLALDTHQLHGTLRNTAHSIVTHWWTFNGTFNVQCGACDEYYPVDVVKEMMEEIRRWIDAIVAESSPKARL